VEGALVAVRPHVELERLELQVLLCRDVVKREVGKVRLTGEWAQASELRDLDMDAIVPSGFGIGESS